MQIPLITIPVIHFHFWYFSQIKLTCTSLHTLPHIALRKKLSIDIKIQSLHSSNNLGEERSWEALIVMIFFLIKKKKL